MTKWVEQEFVIADLGERKHGGHGLRVLMATHVKRQQAL
jgi:hypothetical protein